ncbi:MAG: 2-dehydropantoate 2-reductase [Paracoccaceae bacterium]
MKHKVLIWGAGAIGGTLGAAFLRVGHDVSFVDNVPAHVTAINATGLRIDGPIFQDVVHAPAYLPDDVTGQHDLIFLCVKALHTEAAAHALAPHLSAEGVVVSAQNGLNEIALSRILGTTRVIGCFVNFGADYLEPGVVHYSGHGAAVIGELDGADTPRIQALLGLMQDFDPRAKLTPNIWGYLWGKMIYGALLFGTALTNDGIADVLENPSARAVLTRLGQEVGRVAAAQNVQTEGFDGFDPAAFAPDASTILIDASFADMVAHNRKSAKSHSGIWRDLAIRKRQTEVVAQLGPIVAAGQAAGVPVALTARLIDLIQDIEAGRRGLVMENLSLLAQADGVA